MAGAMWERRGQIGPCQFTLFLPFCLSSLPCPKPGNLGNLTGSGEVDRMSSSSLKYLILQQAGVGKGDILTLK